jgi:hypothetical protein
MLESAPPLCLEALAVLLLFQASDAAGKDGAIGKAMSGVNLAGCQAFSFKYPSATELQHDDKKNARLIISQIVDGILAYTAYSKTSGASSGIAVDPRTAREMRSSETSQAQQEPMSRCRTEGALT